MEKKPISLMILSNTVSLFPSDIKKNMELIQQLLQECLVLFDKTDKEGKSLLYVINPLVVDWLSTNEAKELIEKYFLSALQIQRNHEGESMEELYSLWVRMNRDIPSGLNMLQEEKRITIIPSALTNFPVTHLVTGWGIRMMVQQALLLHRKHFTKGPKGFWLPDCAYTPGIDLYLIELGIEYSFISETTFIFSEKGDGDAGMLGTPRGLMLLPVSLDENNRHLTAVDGSGEIKGRVEELCEYCEMEYSENSLLDEKSTLTRASFGYLGMDQGKAILSDEVLIGLLELHEMERKLKEITQSDCASGRVVKQMIREWISCLHHLLKEEKMEESYLQAFRELEEQRKGKKEDSSLLEYRESVEYLPIEIENSIVEDMTSVSGQRTVLLLSWEYPPNIVGGLSRHVHDLTKSLVKKGCKVILLTASTDGAPAFEVDEGVHVYRTGPLHPMEDDFLHWVFQLNLSFIEKAGEIFRTEEIDLIHAHDWIVGNAACMLKLHYGVPLLTTIHATEHGRNQGIYTNLQQQIHEEEKMLVGSSDKVIICSEHMKEELYELEPRKDLPVSVIPNGVNLHNVNQEAGYLKDQFKKVNYYFSIGRIVHEKGFETIIETAGMISREKGIHFVIAGKGPLLESFRNRVRENGLEEFVHFLGYVSDKERNAFLFHSEAVIFPSFYEPFGIVALEAMAAKRAVIASKTGGLKSLVEHGHAGLLFDPGDARSLGACILNLEEEEEQKKQMGENGYKMAETMFSWERISKQTLELYDELTLQHKVEGSVL
ncbi:glycosyltransferase [Rossellomorea vietnamensis]|uniref:Glycosyltransferase n=1 Tax=Rossellomorea vietnamensis TaxID=218284 RepID=A0A5D4P191_9BACI|nr:glycosyltransferase family 4 protein [Rossellomorea vietnamensis]TYS19466.1 glycosyltransferase [Rossellomorea vietnamensis]